MADDERVAGDARVDEVLGIDKTEQSGLGGDSSVLEAYGEDIERDDLPEPEGPAFEPILPGSDRDEDPEDEDAEMQDTGTSDGGRMPPASRLGDGLTDAAGRHDDVAAQHGEEEQVEFISGHDPEVLGEGGKEKGRFVGRQEGAQTEPNGEDVL